MSKQFNGKIALDIRHSVPDWEPYAEKKAPDKSPNILYIVFDDTGFGAWEMFGGKIKMPNLTRIAQKGLVYTNFHTTALCSPTRSSLLNGRNATSNGMSCIEEATSGFPGNNGRIPFENAFLSAVLNEQGWGTFALGKWHLLPEEEAHMAANKRNWPLGRGFERYYGFLGGETDQWYPDLVYDNHLVEPPAEPNMTVQITDANSNEYDSYQELFDSSDTHGDPKQWTYKTQGYHFSEDLTNKAISFIQDTTAIAPDKPWMMYFCPGANHAPHQIWPEMILKYGYNTTLGDRNNTEDYSFVASSVFGEGYEKYREEILANMRKLGIFDASVTDPTEINPHGEGILAAAEGNHDNIGVVPEGKEWPQTDWVRPWNTLEDNEKALFVRMAEIYAAYSSYTDEQIGRLLDYLEETEQLENTIIIAVSDNGASAEGGPNGSVNENLFFNDIPDSLENNLNYLQDLGTLKTYNHYPSGWAWGFDTPFKYWKRWSGYEGGAATPFMMCDPGITSSVTEGDSITIGVGDGAYDIPVCNYRKQYIHAVDVVPTLYEMCNITAPEVVKGYTQNPIEGISFAYTFGEKFGHDDNKYAYKLADQGELTDQDGNTIDKVRDTQFYSMLGSRGIWYKGWHACAVHPPSPSDWGNFDKDTWELYCMDGDDEFTLDPDPTQAVNLAEDTQYQTKLEQMKNIWFLQAGLYNGIPLEDRSAAEVLGLERPQLTDPPFTPKEDYPDVNYREAIYSYPNYRPGGSEIPESVAPNIRTRSYEIEATISGQLEPDTIGGVILAHGGRFGGHSFYIYNDSGKIKLCYVYNWLGQIAQKCESDITSVLVSVRK